MEKQHVMQILINFQVGKREVVKNLLDLLCCPLRCLKLLGHYLKCKMRLLKQRFSLSHMTLFLTLTRHCTDRDNYNDIWQISKYDKYVLVLLQIMAIALIYLENLVLFPRCAVVVMMVTYGDGIGRNCWILTFMGICKVMNVW